MIYMSKSFFQWLSKKQHTIDTSMCRDEFLAVKIGMETLRSLRYKLSMMGIPLSGPSLICGYNMLVIHNTQIPESTLQKNSNSICYHAIRESVAIRESLTAWVPKGENPSYLLTKVLYRSKRRYIVGNVLPGIYN